LTQSPALPPYQNSRLGFARYPFLVSTFPVRLPSPPPLLTSNISSTPCSPSPPPTPFTKNNSNKFPNPLVQQADQSRRLSSGPRMLYTNFTRSLPLYPYVLPPPYFLPYWVTTPLWLLISSVLIVFLERPVIKRSTPKSPPRRSLTLYRTNRNFRALSTTPPTLAHARFSSLPPTPFSSYPLYSSQFFNIYVRPRGPFFL